MTDTASKSHLAKYARHFFSGTFLSRISGMLRDMSMAAVFGDHPSVAAFMVAFRFAHFLRRIFGEGALQSILIPQYQALSLQDKQKSASFFFQLSTLLFAFLFLLTIVVELGLTTQWGASLFPGSDEMRTLFATLFPSLLFISLYGLNISVLQCQNSFFLSSAAPLACNIIWILGVFATAKLPTKDAMVGLTLFTTLGFGVQWGLTLTKTTATFKEGWKAFKGSLLSFSFEIKVVGKATLFGLIGITAVQINSFLDMIFARFADLKGPIYLWYAIRLEQLPLALIGFACIYSITPSLAKLIKGNSLQEASQLFLFGKKRIFLFVLPSTFALIALGLASVDLLFGRGNFSSLAVLETTSCLIAYGLGLLPSVLAIYLSATLYAFDDYKTPSIASLLSVAFNIVLNTLLVFLFHLGAISIALSTSAAALFNYLLLKRALLIKHPSWKDHPEEKAPFAQLFFACFVALACTAAFDWIYFNGFVFFPNVFPETRSLSRQMIYFCSQFLVFGSTFLISLKLLHRHLLSEMKEMVLLRSK